MRPDSKNEAAYYNLGLSFTLLEQRKDAVLAFQEVINIDRNADDAYFRMGEIILSEGDMKQAEKFFARSSQLKRDSSEYKSRRRRTERRMDKYRSFLSENLNIF